MAKFEIQTCCPMQPNTTYVVEDDSFTCGPYAWSPCGQNLLTATPTPLAVGDVAVGYDANNYPVCGTVTSLTSNGTATLWSGWTEANCEDCINYNWPLCDYIVEDCCDGTRHKVYTGSNGGNYQNYNYTSPHAAGDIISWADDPNNAQNWYCGTVLNEDPTVASESRSGAVNSDGDYECCEKCQSYEGIGGCIWYIIQDCCDSSKNYKVCNGCPADSTTSNSGSIYIPTDYNSYPCVECFRDFQVNDYIEFYRDSISEYYCGKITHVDIDPSSPPVTVENPTDDGTWANHCSFSGSSSNNNCYSLPHPDCGDCRAYYQDKYGSCCCGHGLGESFQGSPFGNLNGSWVESGSMLNGRGQWYIGNYFLSWSSANSRWEIWTDDWEGGGTGSLIAHSLTVIGQCPFGATWADASGNSITGDIVDGCDCNTTVCLFGLEDTNGNTAFNGEYSSAGLHNAHHKYVHSSGNYVLLWGESSSYYELFAYNGTTHTGSALIYYNGGCTPDWDCPYGATSCDTWTNSSSVTPQGSSAGSCPEDVEYIIQDCCDTGIFYKVTDTLSQYGPFSVGETIKWNGTGKYQNTSDHCGTIVTDTGQTITDPSGTRVTINSNKYTGGDACCTCRKASPASYGDNCEAAANGDSTDAANNIGYKIVDCCDTSVTYTAEDPAGYGSGDSYTGGPYCHGEGLDFYRDTDCECSDPQYTDQASCENNSWSSIDVTFDPQTETESSYDYIYIRDGNDTLVGTGSCGAGCYEGTDLAGATITVPTETVKIQLTSDGSVTYYGFKVTNIVGVTGSGPTCSGPFPESPHNYNNNTNQTWVYTCGNTWSCTGIYYCGTVDLNDIPTAKASIHGEISNSASYSSPPTCAECLDYYCCSNVSGPYGNKADCESNGGTWECNETTSFGSPCASATATTTTAKPCIDVCGEVINASYTPVSGAAFLVHYDGECICPCAGEVGCECDGGDNIFEIYGDGASDCYSPANYACSGGLDSDITALLTWVSTYVCSNPQYTDEGSCCTGGGQTWTGSDCDTWANSTTTWGSPSATGLAQVCATGCLSQNPKCYGVQSCGTPGLHDPCTYPNETPTLKITSVCREDLGETCDCPGCCGTSGDCCEGYPKIKARQCTVGAMGGGGDAFETPDPIVYICAIEGSLPTIQSGDFVIAADCNDPSDMVCLEVLDTILPGESPWDMQPTGTREIQAVCGDPCSSCCSDSVSSTEQDCCQFNGGTWDAATSTCSWVGSPASTWTPCGCNNCGT